ncbi:glycoside hydrolase family 13 protein [Tellurirhabdus rosea]|uniref:glycoside hydrolase family 13 protein n=1 Tax=Tellurirhabdus rosea TaxID=2674997 RepID=UPI002255A5B9|nr:alpha-glucosidase [Tellurirhabdus rosea]
MKNWWKEAVVYQIYPRSFQDSNGDGIGDLRGIIRRLDYLQQLGIDVIWLSPHYQSPNDDNGYDISDYEAVMTDFGTMADFDGLLAGIHERGMKLVIDLVVNHSSDEHRWFQESRKSRENPFRDFYIWKPGRDGNPPNNWLSFFSGPAWEYDAATDEYYLHLFSRKQPDLNWDNPALRQEIYRMMRFWLDKGVDGFRMDVIAFISKDQSFPDYPEGRFGDLTIYANGPRIHEFLGEMNQEVLSKYDCMTVGEAFGVAAEQANLYVGRDRGELNMIFHFDHAVPREEERFLDPAPEFRLSELRKIFDKWDKAVGREGWNSVYFGNHDNPRMVSRFGDEGPLREVSAKMLATILLTQRGTPYIFQGDEIGMKNSDFRSIDEYNDIQVRNAWKALVERGGGDAGQFLAAANRIARDHARTPMPWDDGPMAGFTDGPATWLKLNPDFGEINVRKAVSDPESVWHYYRKLIQLRKQHPALIYGDYTDLNPVSDEVFAYTRTLDREIVLVVVNFVGQPVEIDLGGILVAAQKTLLMANYPVAADASPELAFALRPFEARVYRI